MCYVSKSFGILNAEQQITSADAKAPTSIPYAAGESNIGIDLYCGLMLSKQSLVWTGLPYWDLSTFDIHLEQSFLFSFLHKKSSWHAQNPPCKLY